MPAWLDALRRRRAVRRARATLTAPTGRPIPGAFFARSVRFPELADLDRLPGPTLAPYEKLAGPWDAANRGSLPDYPGFLAAMAAVRGRPFGSVLDLACGAGTLAARLAATVPEVAGLDASEAMLALARAHCPSGVALHRADFREFDLGRRFAAVVCASNSLNYVRDNDELTAVFRAVGRHLEPGGLFAFDTTTSFGMRCLSGQYLHMEGAGVRFVQRFRYDPAARRETSAGLVAGGVEPHHRVPLDPADVLPAAAAAGLAVLDHFAPGWGLLPAARFYVLAKPG
jgi:SAM-dependent methyltransferase